MVASITAAATLAPSCEARTGVLPGDYGMTPLWCSARIGLITWTDSQGQTHRACRHHVEGMQRRYPVRHVAEIDGDGLSEAKREAEIAREDAFERGSLTFEWQGHAVDVDLA